MSSSLTEFKSTLASRGYRLTRARRTVLEALIGAGGHVSADELVELIHQSGSGVGRMTVYRTLDLLAKLGLVRPIYQGTGAAHYILLVDGHHHHLICTRCHAVVEVDSCVVKNIERHLM
ncbi:MAG: Fur family transcriptional regulator, partial [Chloroflexota bacterium]